MGSDGKEIYCRGIVFLLDDIDPNKPHKLTNYERIKAMSIDEMAGFLGEKPFRTCEQEDECIYCWHKPECRDYARAWLESEATYADIAPVVHGHWIEEDDTAVCSVCGERQGDTDIQLPYCPWCGAKMDGKDGVSDD